MDKKKSTATANSGGDETTNQASDFSKDAPPCRCTTISMVQNVLLIWLDSNIDEENNDDCRNTINQLRRVVNNINTFTDNDQCVNFLSEINDEKACLIIPGSLGQYIVPMIHDMAQLDSIFIFCRHKTHHETWAKTWPKIKGVFTEISSICEVLKQAVQECEHNSVGISFMPTRDVNASKENSNQLHCSFMYTQILKEILLTIQFEEQHIKEFIDYCRELFVDNTNELKNVKQLEEKYRDKTPIWWYTCESFLYPMLNRALRTMDMSVIIKIGYFVGDLHRHIQQLHFDQFGGHRSGQVFKVYRGQGLSKADFDEMMNTKGGLIAFNSFLSTSKDQEVSRAFARRAVVKPDLIGILFVMTIDSSQSSTPFALVSDVSCFGKREEEILFSMHTVFRIHEIKQMDGNNRLWQVELTLTSENDQDLQTLTKNMQEETEGSSGWFRLGLLLIKMGHSDKAQQVYERMLEHPSNESTKENILHQLGRTNDQQGNYNEALSFYKNSLDIRLKTLPTYHPDLAKSYNNIGAVYYSMGEYLKALSSHETALKIRQMSLPPHHFDVAMSYDNIGVVNGQIGQYSKALSYCEIALETRQKTLPPNHPDLASSYNNIGSVYDNMGEYSKALPSHEKALEIRKISLPPHHIDLAKSYDNIGLVYNNIGEYSKALSSHEKALEINQKSLSPNHPDLASSYNHIGNVYGEMGEYSKALWNYTKALDIRQKSLPPHHPDLAASYNDIGNVYGEMGEYSKELSSHEKALVIRQKSLPPNHRDLASSYNNIGSVYNDMGEYSKARSFYERTVNIGQISLPLNHPELETWRKNLDMVNKKL